MFCRMNSLYEARCCWHKPFSSKYFLMISQVSGCLISSSSMWSAMVLPRHPAHPRPSRHTRPNSLLRSSPPPPKHDFRRDASQSPREGFKVKTDSLRFRRAKGHGKGGGGAGGGVGGGVAMNLWVDRPRNLARALPVVALCACALAGVLILQGEAGLWWVSSSSSGGALELYEQGSRGRYGGALSRAQ